MLQAHDRDKLMLKEDYVRRNTRWEWAGGGGGGLEGFRDKEREGERERERERERRLTFDVLLSSANKLTRQRGTKKRPTFNHVQRYVQ